ncbi:glycosyltransferase family 39 protein [Caloramator sp. mosi_1]|uniref:glycosyltransferase family 39 protein n=1 Tax=Caloramator sp. mosi_1 TaxID=3023090 RepID=UPI002360C701|nr:glycosyltransferase family 39 protein [Caloramator sp. mosi_1]WDC85665.1 glycosyltransferase family 39 protein [Caloramator sp. mosi_1]
MTYTAVYCSENIAMPFYLLSIYVFVRYYKNKRNFLYIILCGLILGIGHLFRMVGDVILIAYIMFILIYIKDNIFNKSKFAVGLVIAFLVPMLSVNAILKELKITQYNLWRGSETKLTSVLRGSNMDTFGRWNMEDAKFIASFDDDKELEAAIKQKLKERYTQTPLKSLFILYLKILHTVGCR